MKKQPAIILRNVNKSYFIERPKTLKKWIKNLILPFKRFQVIKNFSATINQGDFVVVEGPNGSGKSTLMRLIAGITEPDSGEILTAGKIIPLIELGAGFNIELTGRENIIINATILKIKKESLVKIMDKIIRLSRLKNFIDVPLKRYSSGMLTRLAFSIAAHSNPDILLLDEVFAIGDREFQKKSYEILEKFHKEGKTILICSHFDLKLPFITKKIILKHSRSLK